MLRLLLLVALCGVGLVGAAPQQVEVFDYRAIVKTGVQNPRQVFAGTRMYLSVEVSRKSDQSAKVTIVKKNVELFNREELLGERQPLEPSYRRHSVAAPSGGDDVTSIEGSFTALLNQESGTVMKLDSPRELWVTNLWKGIMNMLRVPPYLGDRSFVDLERNVLHAASEMSTSTASQNLAYFKTEDTFAGRCNVSYSMNPDFAAGEFPGSPSNVLPADPTKYYRLHRAIDFDSCSDAVSMHKTSFGNFSKAHRSQFEEVQTRSAVSDYLLFDRGDGFFDIKGVMQVGNQFVRPFGMDSGRILLLTNQTLTLQKVTPGGGSAHIMTPEDRSTHRRVHARSGDGERTEIKTWKCELRSPAAPRDDSKVDWIDYVSKGPLATFYPEWAILGRSVKNEDENKKATQDILNELATSEFEDNKIFDQKYNGTTDGRLAEQLNRVARTVRTLTYDSIRKLLKDNPKDAKDRASRAKRQCLLDALVASGSAPALKAVLDEAKDGHIDNIRMGGLMTGMVNNIYDSEPVKDIMEYVKTLEPSKSPYLASQAHLNFAMLAQRVCTRSDVKRYAVPNSYIGNKACDKTIIEDGFVKHLEDRIKSATSVWEQMMYTQTLGTLSLESTIPFLKDVCLGKIKNNIHLRMAAIHSLAHNFMQKPLKNRVETVLLALAESHADDFRIREAAFISLMTLEPNATMIERFAQNSWRDPSSHMQSLITSTLIALAESDSPSMQRQSNIARKFLPKVKPVQPSVRNSVHFLVKTRVPDYKVDVEQTISWLTKYRSPIAAPQQLFAAYDGDFGGIVVPLMETFSMLDSNQIRGLAASANGSKVGPIHQELDQLANSLELEKSSSDKDIYVYMSGFNYQGFMAYNSKKDAPMIQNFLKEKATKEKKPFMPEHMIKYYNPVDITSILPTPVGLHVITQVQAPNHYMLDCDYTLDYVKDDMGNSIANLTLDGINKITMKTQTFMSVLVPWEEKAVSAGFDTEATITFPGKLSVTYNDTYPFTILRHEVSPNFRGEQPVLYWRSKPMSMVRSMDPTVDRTIETNILIPVGNKTNSYQKKIDVPKNVLGLKAKLRYDGDVDFPLQQANVLDYLRYPERLVTLLSTPTARDSTLYFALDIDQSETKNISIAVVTDFGFLDNDPGMTAEEQTAKTGQHIARNLSVLNSPEVQTSQVQRRELGDFLVSLSVNYTTPGVRTRQYQVALTGTNQTKPNPTELQQLVVLNLMAVGIPGTNGERKVCLVTTLKEKRPPCKRDQSPVYTTAVTDIYAGAQCSDSEKIGTLKSDLFLSADEKDITPPHRLSSTAPCADHITDPASQTPWNQDAIYDRLNFELKYNKEMPSFYRNQTNWVQDVSEGYVFPHLVKNHDAGNNKPPKDSGIVNVTRNVASGVIDAWVHTYYGISEVQNFAVWPVFDWMTPLLGARIPYKHHFDSKSTRGVLAPFSSAAQCTVTAEQVSTFDGVQYSKEPCTCWTVAAQVYHEDDAFTVLARRASHSADAPAQVKILAPGIAKLEMEGKQVKINDQTVSVPSAIKTPSGQVVGSVNAVDNGIQVSVPGKFKVSLQEESTVQISLPERYRSKMQGLCGDYNADSSEDLKSPAKVVFPTNKGQLFAASWIPQKGQCSDNDMQPLIKKVNEIESSGHRSSSRH